MDLHGKTILITRAASQSGQLKSELESAGARVLECPAIEIVPVDDWTAVDVAIRNLNSYHWIIFTSTNAVDLFMRRVQQQGASCSVPIAAVGASTAKKLEQWQVSASKVPASFRAEGLLEMFPNRMEGVRILLPRAEKARELLPEQLRKRGAVVDVVAVYRTTKAESSLQNLQKLLADERIDMAAFLSPSAVGHFSEQLAELGEPAQTNFRSIPIAAIGPVAKEALVASGLRVDVQPDRATVQDLVAEIRTYFNNQKKSN